MNEVSYFRGYFLNSESMRALVDYSFETSVKRAFEKVLLLYRASIGAENSIFTLQEKLTKNGILT